MKKKILFILILFISFILTGCSDRPEQDEIYRIDNLINGTE